MKFSHAFTFALSMVFLGFFFQVVSDMYPERKYPNHAHITLYLDRYLDEYEDEAITQAALEWMTTTNHIIEFDVVKLPTKEKINFRDSIFIDRKSPDNSNIIISDSEGKDTMGLYEFHRVHTISMVTDRIDPERYKEIALHELGHALGLPHLEGPENIDTLMYPFTGIRMPDGTVIPTGADHITYKDLILFCELYRCNPIKLKPNELQD